MDIFKELIKALTPLLRRIGFHKKGNTFYLEANRNYGVVTFQKSREASRDIVKFTINFGIYSDVLGQSQYGNWNHLKPEVEQCHWQSRVGSFMPGSPDYWWNLKTSDTLSNITSSVIEVVQNIVVPQLSKRLSDEGLTSSWMNEGYAGTTEIGRFKYLTTLLKAKGDLNTLNQVVETFMQQSKGKPNANRAIEHIREINYGN
ncbi:MAG: DUF4304 domain-containing protein [Bacteroidia bacterium]|nr:DUF4304 domain-containing protein [Bacteroidia bacterium]